MNWDSFINTFLQYCPSIHDIKEGGEAFKAYVEATAVICGAFFFLNKFRSGYLVTNLSLSIKCDRTNEGLVIVANITKGDRDTVLLHDAQARITHGSQIKTVAFIGVERLSMKRVQDPRRWKINWEQRSKAVPFIRLSPGEQTELSCFYPAPSEELCEVEVVILGKKANSGKTGQWRASCISRPGNLKQASAQPLEK